MKIPSNYRSQIPWGTLFAWAVLMFILFVLFVWASESPAAPQPANNVKTTAWGWWDAGLDGEQLVLVDGPKGELIDEVYNQGWGPSLLGVLGRRAGFRDGVDLHSWSTTRGLLGIDRWPDGQDHYGNVYRFPEGQAAFFDGDFYIAAVCANERSSGERELLGRDASGWVKLDQKRNRMTLWTGALVYELAPEGTVPRGVFLLEIARINEVLLCAADGVVLTTQLCGDSITFSGLGWKGNGTSQWDDYTMAFVMQPWVVIPWIVEARNTLMAEWGL